MSMSRSNDRPWNSDSEHSSNTVEMSEDSDQLLIDSLIEEVKTLKQIIRLLLDKDKEKSQRIIDLHNIIMTRTCNTNTGNILEFL